jgi:hypothetical protein
MFERLKKVFNTSGKSGVAPEHAASVLADPLARWATAQGYSYTAIDTAKGPGKGFTVTGEVAGKPFKLERGRASRDYIHGDELRARAELQVNDDAAVLIMSRPLKESLEKKAYEMYTDTLQTTADPSLPEEMRWLAMYQEVGWDSLSPAFWKRYSVLADQREHAQLWLTQALGDLLMSWPEPAPSANVPFILMLLRGKAYLRMQYSPADLPTLAHGTQIFSTACESAVAGLGADISL